MADKIALPLTLITASNHGRRKGGGGDWVGGRHRRPPHLSPELSACSTDRHSHGWDGLLAYYWDCTAHEKHVRSKSNCALLISRFRLRLIVAKVFDFRLRFDYRLMTSFVPMCYPSNANANKAVWHTCIKFRIMTRERWLKRTRSV